MSNETTKRGGSQKVTAPVAAIPGTNFFTQLILLIGSIFTFFAFSEQEIGAVVSAVFALIGFGAALREKAKAGVTADWLKWLKSPNTWSYLAAVLTGILPMLSPDAVKYLQSLTEGVLAGNWQQAITAAFSLLSILFFTFKPKAAVKE